MRARLSSKACELSLTARNWGEPVSEHTTAARNYTGFAMFELHTCSSIKYKYVMIIHIDLSITGATRTRYLLTGVFCSSVRLSCHENELSYSLRLACYTSCVAHCFKLQILILYRSMHLSHYCLIVLGSCVCDLQLFFTLRSSHRRASYSAWCDSKPTSMYELSNFEPCVCEESCCTEVLLELRLHMHGQPDCNT